MNHLFPATLVLCLAAYCGGAAAAAAGLQSQVPQMPPGNPMLDQLGETSGTGEAVAKACGLDQDNAAFKRKQQEQFLRMGGTREQFEAAYARGHDRGKARFDAASPAEHKRMCDEYRNFLSTPIGG